MKSFPNSFHRIDASTAYRLRRCTSTVLRMCCRSNRRSLFGLTNSARKLNSCSTWMTRAATA